MSTKNNSTSYNLLIEKVFALTSTATTSKKDLKPIEELAGLLNHPQNSFKSVHVAGSNGKGSVSTKIAKALEKEGYKCGLFTSPHITSYKERFQIGGDTISEEAILRLLPPILKLSETITFFEATTLLAFSWFAEQRVEWAVIEVGLGGRLDATNIIFPELAVITSISLDHTEILGSTLESIAREKGGILKAGIPAVIGPHCPPYPHATQVKGLFESYDEENSATARCALEKLGISETSITYGLQFRPPCRAEWVKEHILLDVAHNPEGVKQMLNLLKGKKAHFVLGFSRTKSVRECLAYLLPQALSFTLTSASPTKAFTTSELKRELESLNCCVPIEEIASPYKAAQKALTYKELVVITGSFYIMADVKAAFSEHFNLANPLALS